LPARSRTLATRGAGAPAPARRCVAVRPGGGRAQPWAVDDGAHTLVRPLRVAFYRSASLLARVSAQPTRPGTVLLVAAQPVEDEYSLPAVSIPVNVKASRRTEVRARPAATMDPRVG
jgi:hypothetical protein